MLDHLRSFTSLLLASSLVWGGSSLAPAWATPSSLRIVAADSSVQAPPTQEEKPAAEQAKAESATDDSNAEKSEENSAQKDSAAKESSDSKDEADPKPEAKPEAKEETKEASKESAEESKDSAAKKKPKPYKVKAEKLTVELELDGVFVAEEMEEIALRPEVWSRFKVLEAVEHGTPVKKGDVLVRFDPEDLEKDLEEQSLEQRISEIALMQDEEVFPREKRMLELNYEQAKRRYEQTKADYEYYHETDRPTSVKVVHFRYKSAQEQLASAREELEQLQQMYEADELTEETEEIVLRRQKFAVETAELVLSLNKESRDYTLNVSLPRTDEYYKTALEQAELEYKQAKTALELGGTRKSFDMEKKRQARADSVERHAKLLTDKALLTLRSPADGTVYYGECVDGKWSQLSTLRSKLRPFSTAPVNTVLMTVVKPGPVHVLAQFTEKQFPDIKKGMQVTLVPTADEDEELPAEVALTEPVPGVGNKFQVKIEVDEADVPEWLVAGMTCEAKVLSYENKEALVVPQALVQTDEEDEKTKYVMLLDPEEDKPVRREVKLGREQDKKVEILKGLKAGDEIVPAEKDED